MPQIAHINQADFPQFRFEWHPGAKANPDSTPGIVYVIRTTTPEGEPLFAEPFAWTVGNIGAAHNAVFVWLRGYQSGRAEINGLEQQAAESNYVSLA